MNKCEVCNKANNNDDVKNLRITINCYQVHFHNIQN